MYELAQHTADVRLVVSAATIEDLFRDAVRGLYAVMRGKAEAGASPVRRVVVVEESADRTALLVDFLNEVLHRAHVAGERFEHVTFTRLGDTSLAATLTGVAPAAFEEDVKAVTYHEADVRQEDRGWRTTLVLDV